MLTKQQRQHLDWNKNSGIIPAIVQHAISGEVLMMGYMNSTALEVTEKYGKITFFSRTKKRLWTKGEESGYFLQLISIHPDCDYDTLLFLALPKGPTCHYGNDSCFYYETSNLGFFYKLETKIKQRKLDNSDKSYTANLYASGTKRIAQKVGEEAIETALAAMIKNKYELINESADLLYHLLVLLLDQDLSLNDVVCKLRER